MGKKERNLKKETLLQALESSLGIVSTACNRSGISSSSFYKWYKEDEEFRKKVDEIDNLKLDFAESQLHKQIQDNSTSATIFYLKTQGKKRGYIERQEVDLSSGNEQINKIEIEIIEYKGNSSPTKES